MRERPIPRVPALDPSEFRERFVHCREPVVIEGAIDGWRALSAWTPEYLASVHGEARVSLRVSPLDSPQLYRGDPLAAFARIESSFGDFIAEAGSSNPQRRAYLQYADLARDLPRLRADVAPPVYCPRWFLSPAFLWMCGTGTVNPLHYDYNHVLMAQVVGKKRYVLFSPKENRRISHWFSRIVWRTTPIDVDRPDRVRFPDYDDAVADVCTLAPGELLLIPYRYWHYASVDELSISVSWWWEPNLWAKSLDALISHSLLPLRRALRRYDGS